ncbi:hypothetical protein KAR28_05080 [Candidatus Parcubacteria bacterium]|nr:hypothetical protein [Candidatus Parcubacteria bacterium]
MENKFETINQKSAEIRENKEDNKEEKKPKKKKTILESCSEYFDRRFEKMEANRKKREEKDPGADERAVETFIELEDAGNKAIGLAPPSKQKNFKKYT